MRAPDFCLFPSIWTAKFYSSAPFFILYSRRARGNEPWCETARYLNILSGSRDGQWTPSSIQIIYNINSPLSQWSNWHRLYIFLSIGWEIARRDLQTSRQAWEHAIGEWEYSGKVQSKLQIQDARNNAFRSGGVWQDPAGLVAQLRGEGQVRWRDGQAQRRTWEGAGETLKDTVFRFFLHCIPLRARPASTRLLKRRPSWSWTRPTRRSTSCARRWSGTPERVAGWVSTSEDARLVYDSRFEKWSEMIMDDHQWSYDGSIKEALFLVPPTFGFLSPSLTDGILLNLVFIIW